MAVELDCTCGERFAVAAALAGLFVRCRACGASVPVPRADGTLPARPVAPPPPPPPAPPAPAPARTRAPSATDLKLTSGPADPQEASRATDTQDETGWFSGGVIGGLSLIVLSVVWLGIGLALDRLFIYPIILFFVGVGTLIKGAIDNK